MESYLEENLWGHYIPGNGTPFEEVGVLGALANPQSTSVKNAQLSSDHLPQDIFLETDDALMSLEPNNFFPLLSASTISFTQNNSNQPQTLPINLTTETAITTDPLTGTITHESELNINPINSTPLAQTQTVAFEPNNSSSVSSPLTFAVKAEGTVTVNSSSSDFDGEPLDPTDDALIYAGKGFTINGNPVLPVQRDSEGNPLVDDSGKPIVVDNAVAVSSNYWYTNTSANYSGLIPPQIVAEQFVVIPTYEQQINQQLEKRLVLEPLPIFFNTSQNPINNANEWYQKFPGGGTSDNPSVIRVTNGGLTVPDQVTLSHTIIIVEQGTINFNGNGHELDNVMLVAENGNINLAQVQGTDLAVFASGTINTNGGSKFGGQSVLANNTGDINFNGATKTITEADFLRVVSAGSITYNSSSNTRGEFLSRQNFTFNSSSTLVGSIGAKGNIIFNNGATVIGISSNTDVNIPPTITLDNTVSSLEENLDTTNALKVADIVINDDGEGNNSLNLSGEDSDFFEIVGDELFLKAGTILDFEEKSVYNVTVSVDDTSIGNGLDDSIAYSLAITDVNLPPTVTLENTVSSLEENLDTTNAQKVADIIISDDGEGNNNLSLSGEDSDFFEIIDNQLFLKAGVSLDFETKNSYNVRVEIDDVIIGETPDNFIDYNLTITDVNLPPTVTLENTVSSLEENLDTTNAQKVADIVINDDGEGNNSLNLSGQDADFFEIVGNQLFLKAGTILDYENKPVYDVTVLVDDVEIETSTDAAITYNLTIVDINESPDADPDKLLTVNPNSGENNLNITPPLDPDNDLLTLTIIGIPNSNQGIVKVNNSPVSVNQTLTISELQQLVFIPARGVIGSGGNFSYSVEDPDGERDTQTITFNISPVIILREGENFEVVHSEAIIIPETPSKLRFTYTSLNFDRTDTDFINDGLEVALLDSNGESLVSTIGKDKDAFFNLTEGFSPLLAQGVSVDGQTVTLDLSPLIAQTSATLVFRLINNDQDTGTTVTLRDMAVETAESTNITPPLPPGVSLPSSINKLPSFDQLEDVSNSIQVNYGRTSFQEEAQVLYTDLAVENIGNYPLRDQLLVAVTNLSDPSVSVVGMKGKTPSGLPYFDFSYLIQEGILDPNQTSQTGTISFYNPDKIQFTYDLVVLSQLNQAPVWVSEPEREIKVNHSYNYQLQATDPDGDSLTYKLLASPQGLILDETSQTLIWTPTEEQIGNHNIILEVRDGQGGSSQQSYTLGVFQDIPNRPPLITSTPEVDGFVNTKYDYQVMASDLDGDELSYHLIPSENQLTIPDGMTINETSGLIEWTPNVNQLGQHNFLVEVRDGQGNSTQQSVELNIKAEKNNNAPVIISSAITELYLDSDNYHYLYDVNALDPDEDLLTYTLVESPSEMTIDSNTGQINWQPTTQQIGNHQITVEVTDGRGGIDNQTFVLEVLDIEGGIIQGIVWDDLNANGFRDTEFVQGDNPEIVFVLDISGSTGSSFSGTAVGDINQDGRFNTILDAELASLLALNNQLIELGLGSRAKISLVLFESTARSVDLDINAPGEQLITTPSADNNNNGIIDLEEIVTSIRLGGGTNFKAALDRAIDVFEALETESGDGNLLFFSDGSASNNFEDEVTRLTELGVNLSAFGVGNGASLNLLEKIDPNVQRYTSTDELLDIFNNLEGDVEQFLEPGLEGVTVYLDLNNNGYLDFEEPQYISRIDDPDTLDIDERGQYEFTGLAPGTYTVGIVVPSNREQTYPNSPSSFNVNVSFGDTINKPFGTVSTDIPPLNIDPTITSDVPDDLMVGQTLLHKITAIDENNDPITFTLSLKPDGMAIDPNTGILIWNPTAAQVGEHQVFVKVSDDEGGFDLQGFTIVVTSENTAPVITSTPVTTAGSNSPYQYQIQAQDDQTEGLTFILDNAPDGMSVDGTTGLLTWQPTENQEGTHNVTLRVEDELGANTTQNFTIKVISDRQNDAPILTSTPGGEIKLGRPYLYQIKADDPNGDPLTYTLETAPEGMNISDEGLIYWTPTPTQLGEHKVILHIADGQGGITQLDFTLVVVSQNQYQNQNPLIDTTPNSFNATVGQTYEYNPTASDSDGHQLQWQLINAPDGMSVNSDTGTLRWIPTSEQLGTHDVELQVMDSYGAFRNQTFTLTVRGVNVAPTVTSRPNPVAQVDQLYQYQITASDTEGQSLTYLLQNSPDGLIINPQTGLIQWIPQTTQQGNHTLTVVIEDDDGATTNQTFTLTVEPPSSTGIEAPTILLTPAIIGQSYQYQVLVENDQGQPLTYRLQTAPDGLILNEQTGLIQWTPQSTQEGKQTIVVTVEDETGEITTQTYTVTVADVSTTETKERINPPTIGLNQPPAITSKPVYTGTIGNPYTYTVTAEDINGDTITFRLIKAPQGMTLDPNTGQIQWTNPINGNHTVAVAAIDSQGTGGVQEFTLNIIANAAPIIQSTPVRTASPGQPYGYDLRATDSNADALSYHLITAPDGMTIDELGRVRWTPNGENTGNYPIEIAVTDSRGATVTQSFSLEVVADTLAPMVRVNPSVQPVNLGQSVTLYVRATDNIGVSTLSLTVNGQAVTLDGNGLYTFTPDTVGTIEA
ncbi:MAG: putative Ig domain-containing protein, partial [Crocosphaera sp.]